MKTLKLEVELTYDDEMMHSGDNGDAGAKEWFFNDVLANGKLELFDKTELGDEIGVVKVTRIDGKAI
mgnify:CR=1 FL=1